MTNAKRYVERQMLLFVVAIFLSIFIICVYSYGQKCSKRIQVSYYNQTCQRKDWKIHKHSCCSPLDDTVEENENDEKKEKFRKEFKEHKG